MVRQEAPFTITFDIGTSSPVMMKTDASGKLAELFTPAREGYTFDGWYTEKTGGTKISTDTVFTTSTTVYAHWSTAPAPTPSGGSDNTPIIIGA